MTKGRGRGEEGGESRGKEGRGDRAVGIRYISAGDLDGSTGSI